MTQDNIDYLEKRDNDCKRILDWMKEKGSITPMEALNEFGCYRLGARIWDLRHRYGLKIRTELIKMGDSEKYARYVLEEGALLF